jgi:hypothetical protein
MRGEIAEIGSTVNCSAEKFQALRDSDAPSSYDE